MAASLSGVWNAQEFTDTGALMAGGRLYTYSAGTTTLKTAYTEPTGTVAHTYTSDGSGGSYIALNSRGELPAPLFLTSGAYDLTLKTSAGVTVWTRRAVPQSDPADAVLSDLASTSDVSKGDALIGVKRTAIGAVAANLHTWMDRQVLNVLDFGADPTGASDSTGAFNAAIAAAALVDSVGTTIAGGAVYIPGGEYLISSALATITADNLAIFGDGARSSTLKVASAFNLFSVSGSVGLTFRDFGIRTTNTNLTSGNYFSLDNASGARFLNLELRGWYNAFDCIGVTRSTWTAVYCNQIGRTAGLGNNAWSFRGTSSAGGCSGNHLTDCEVWSSSTLADPAYNAAVNVTSADGLYLTQCHFTGGTYDLNIAPDGTTNNDTLASLTAVNCYFDTCSANCVRIVGTASAYRDIQFVGCRMRAAGGTNVTVSPDATCVINGLQFIGCQIRSSGTAGLSLGSEYNKGATIAGCTFAGNNTTNNASGHDLTLRGDSHTVTSNTFIDGSTTGNCISIASTARSFVLSGNNWTSTLRTTPVANSASAQNGYVIGPNAVTKGWALFDDVATLQTTNNTATAVWTYSMEQESILFVDADVVGARTTMDNGTAVKVCASFYRDGAGAPVQIGTDTAISTQESNAGYLVDIDTSGNNVRIMVTGLAAGNDDWVAYVRARTRKV